jgi:peptide-methionine (R)-S-oxide reductase
MLSLSSSTSFVAIAIAGLYGTAELSMTRGARAAMPPSPAIRYRVTRTDAEWRKILSPAAYHVLRQAGTELPFTSSLLHEHRHGIFNCAGCALSLYSSATKYDSGTGWPSFWDHLPNAILTSDDDSLGMQRTEVHCSQCGGHLGHVFPDGPPPTGLRYCMNGVALSFTSRAA